MALERNELVYLSGLGIALAWDVAQAWLVRANDVLLGFSLLTLAVTTIGLVATLTDIDKLRKWWMLGYVVPAGLVGFGMAQGNYELQNTALAVANIDPIPSPLHGTSQDYVAAVYSHYFSMCLPALAWLAAYMAPLAVGVYRRIRA